MPAEVEHTTERAHAPDDENTDFERELVRGAGYNALSLLGGLLNGLWVPVATLLFGAASMGGYWVVLPFAEVLVSLIAQGFCDATLVYGSRTFAASKHEDRDALYRLAGFALFAVGALGLAAGIGVQLAAPALTRALNLDAHFVLPLILAGWSVLPLGLAEVLIALSKTNMRMQESALVVGGVRPVSLMVLTPIAWWLAPSTAGILGAWLGSQIILFVFALRAVARWFDLRALLRRALRPRPSAQMLKFALPQSLNMTLNRYNTRLDMVMLAAFGTPEVALGAYGFAAWLVGELRAIRRAFSGALGPIAARHHARGETRILEEVLNRTSRWTTALVALPVIGLAAAWPEVLVVGGVGAARTGLDPYPAFVALLLVVPFINCAWGLAGNLLIFTGHSGWNLFNTALVAILNTGLNWLLIPRYGLVGAAGATVFAVGAISVLQLIELHQLERMRLRARAVWVPYVALLCTLAAVAGLAEGASTPALRVCLALGAAAAYVATLKVLGMTELKDLRALMRRRREA